MYKLTIGISKMSNMKSITRMTRDEVHNYMDEHEIEVSVSYTEVYDKDGNPVEGTVDDDDDYIEPEAGEDDTVYEFWGFSGKTGFSTFDSPMKEDKAKYAAVMFYRLVKEHGICFPDAEMIAGSFVNTYVVMKKPLTEEEQEEFRQKAIAAIDAGNVVDCTGMFKGHEDESHD